MVHRHSLPLSNAGLCIQWGLLLLPPVLIDDCPSDSGKNWSDMHAGQPGEQWTMFFKDPSGNALEFKAMTNPENLFAKYFVS